MRVEFVLEGAPVPCARPRVVRQMGQRIRTIMPASTALYQRALRDAAEAARPAGWRSDLAAYTIWVDVYRARNAGDLDNFLKNVCDGIQGVLVDNDGAIVGAHVLMMVDKARPRVRVVLEPSGVT